MQVDEVKLGAKVVLRPKQVPVEEPPPPELFMEDEEEEPELSQGNGWVSALIYFTPDIKFNLIKKSVIQKHHDYLVVILYL